MPLPRYYPDRDRDLADLGDAFLNIAEDTAKLAVLVVVLPAALFAGWAWCVGLGLL